MSFNQEWKNALKSGPKTGVEGAWRGTWNSTATGHKGGLRCVVSPAKSKDGTHEFHYFATWGAILSGGFRADHKVTPNKKGATFKGQHQMPEWAGGLYTYDGSVVGDAFHAAYKCAKDNGNYTMQRVK
jgi:hypothetical protein